MQLVSGGFGSGRITTSVIWEKEMTLLLLNANAVKIPPIDDLPMFGGLK